MRNLDPVDSIWNLTITNLAFIVNFDVCRSKNQNINEFLPIYIYLMNICILGQGSGHTDWEHLLKIEIDAGQEGRKQKQFIIKPFKENQRPFGSESNAIPYRRHNVLLWLWINATASAYPCGSKVLCGLRNSCKYSIMFSMNSQWKG